MNTKDMIALQYTCNTLAMELAGILGYITASAPDDLEGGVVFQQKMAYINMYKARIVRLCGGVMTLDEDTSSLECDTSPVEASTDDSSQ